MRKQYRYLLVAFVLILSGCLPSVTNTPAGFVDAQSHSPLPNEALNSDSQVRFVPYTEYEALFGRIKDGPTSVPEAFSKATPDQTRLLAFGAVLATRNNDTFDTIGTEDSILIGLFNDQTKAEIIARDWGISDRKSAISQLQNLQISGHRYTRKAAAPSIIEAIQEFTLKGTVGTRKSRAGYNEIYDAIVYEKALVSEGPANLQDATLGILDTLSVLIADFGYTLEELQAVRSLSAWDYDRMVTLSRWCYSCGYITEEECLNSVRWVAEQATKEYGGWREYFAAVMLGRVLWNGATAMPEEDMRIARKLLQNTQSIYLAVPFFLEDADAAPQRAIAAPSPLIAALFADDLEIVVTDSYRANRLQDGTVEIVEYFGNAPAMLVIPDEIKGYPISAIGAGVFQSYNTIEVVTIPDTVRIIGASAFQECSALQTVVLPSSLVEIGDNAFRECIALKDISMPENLKHIGAGAFYKCKSLEATLIPESVEMIDWLAFGECHSLRDVLIPANASLQGGVFVETPWLENQSESQYIIVGNNHYIYLGKEREVIVPAGVRSVDFFENEFVERLLLPDSITEIGAYSLCYLTGLRSIDIPDGVTQIGEGAFWGCTGLLEISLPEHVFALGASAFRDCISLRKITINETLQTVGGSAFLNCRGLKDVSLPDSITEVGEHAFANCSALKNIVLPKGLRVIREGLFHSCTTLEDIFIPEGVTTVEQIAFYNCTALKSINMPSSIEHMEFYVFAESGLKSITFSSDAPNLRDTFARVTGVTIYYPINAKGWDMVNIAGNQCRPYSTK